MDAVHDVAQVTQGSTAGLPRLRQHLPGALGITLDQLGGHPQRHPETGQASLGPVVQVTLDPAQLG